jgi:hypothetical protein
MGETENTPDFAESKSADTKVQSDVPATKMSPKRKKIVIAAVVVALIAAGVVGGAVYAQ